MYLILLDDPSKMSKFISDFTQIVDAFNKLANGFFRTYPEDVPFVVDDMRRFYDVLPLGEIIKSLGKSHGFTSKRLKWTTQTFERNEHEFMDNDFNM